MKKLLFISFGLLLAINYGLSQSLDNQWLIRNGMGKNGVSTTTHENIYTYPLTTNFSLAGVMSADANVAGAKNDLFIIYADGTHFNSRNLTPSEFFTTTSSPAIVPHYFERTPGVNILYGYMTNIYEGDDLPTGVRVPSSQLPSAPLNTLGITTSKILTADHDVVFGKDITLIINYDSILNILHGDGNITLDFAGIQPHGGGAVTPNQDFLDLQPVFGTSVTNRTMAVYPNSPVDPGIGNEIILHPGTELFGYVNLRPNGNLNNYAPDAKGNPTMDAVFTVKRGGSTITHINEAIRLSHDPNFLRVISICQASDGGYLVTYRLQFENDGQGDATTLSAEVTFPPQFDLNCLFSRDWYAAGKGCFGKISKNGNVCTFSFRGHGQLMSILHPNRADRIGFVIFTVKVNPGIDVSDVGVSLELINPTVYFDKQPYPLNLFYDLRECKQDSTTHPASLSQSMNQSAKGNKEKKDTSALKEKKDISDKNKGDAKSALLSQPVGGDFHCYRPISPGPCECKKPFCWKCVIWAAALLGLALLLYYFIKKWNKPTPPKPPLTPNS